MFQKSGAMFKVEEFVEITLAGKDPFEAVVFLSVGDRLIDLLNDARLFIPVKRMDNSTMIMAKSNIISIVEKDPFLKTAELDGEEITVGQSLAEAEDIGEFGEQRGPVFDENPDDASGTQSADRNQSGAQSGSGEEGNSDNSGGADGRTNKGEHAKRRRRRKKAPEFDAYAILKVSPDATTDEIRSAYKSRIKAVHPDTVAALDLDDELIQAAIQTTQKVNYAYHHILKERRTQSEDEAGQAA